ncbi:hypothetical protein NW762_003085 [Fusarium torreyae]|uniref:Uncharacterized protein n=1 Tax=Fusarium torreyae TaxID=1237075 RepID=A0A9W8SAC7_9HYPO|nr:hypothetical protein NW762_003085 [Fusarium torreyae]
MSNNQQESNNAAHSNDTGASNDTSADLTPTDPERTVNGDDTYQTESSDGNFDTRDFSPIDITPDDKEEIS